MTHHEGNRKSCLARGIQNGLETAQGETKGNSQLHSGPTESRVRSISGVILAVESSTAY